MMKKLILTLTLFAAVVTGFSQDFQRKGAPVNGNLNVEKSLEVLDTTNLNVLVVDSTANFNNVVNFSGDSLKIDSKVTIVDDSIDFHTDTACCGFVGLRARLAGGNIAYGYYNTALARAASVVQKGPNFYGTYYLLAFKQAILRSDSIAAVQAPDVRIVSSDSLFFMNLPIDTVGLPIYRLYRDSTGAIYQKRN